jgi:hypothetical protein
MPLSTLVLIGANLVPLAGVVFWGWDVFVLLILYWLETAVIGFWTMVRVVIVPRPTLNAATARIGATQPISGIGAALFLTVHAGIFMTVHFLFLWTLFAGDCADRIHGPVEFVSQIVLGTGLWLPLGILFVVRGWYTLRPLILGEPDQDGDRDVLTGLYTRVVVMQVAIIFGGWLAIVTGGGIATLGLLVIGKTLVEFYGAWLSAHADNAAAKAIADRDKAG